jgi:microcin C transport system ATP-binding protein
VVHALAHDLMVIKHGRVVEQGPARRVFAAPEHAYTQELMKASGLKLTARCNPAAATHGV